MSAMNMTVCIIRINPLIKSCVFKMPTHSIDVGCFDVCTTLEDGRKQIHFSKTIDLCNICIRMFCGNLKWFIWTFYTWFRKNISSTGSKERSQTFSPARWFCATDWRSDEKNWMNTFQNTWLVVMDKRSSYRSLQVFHSWNFNHGLYESLWRLLELPFKTGNSENSFLNKADTFCRNFWLLHVRKRIISIADLLGKMTAYKKIFKLYRENR